jgi:signal peptidase I
MPKDQVKPTPKKYTMSQFLRDILEVLVPAVILYLIISTFFLQSREVPSASMVPTIEEHDRFLLNKTAYWFHKPKRFDIVVFKPPVAAGSTLPFVKRVIGLPGETIKISQGVVYINNRPLNEPYLKPDRTPNYDFGPYIIPEDQVIVLGDNRRNSHDSHVWGPLPLKNVEGHAWWRYWPVDRMGLVK